MKKSAPIILVLCWMVCQVWAQPDVQIGLPLSGQVQSDNGYILQFGIMEEATPISPALSPTITSTTITATSTTSITMTTLPPEPAPEIKVWFDNRLYQSVLTEKGNEFIISKHPKIKIEITLSASYALSSNLSHYAVTIDKGSSTAKIYQATQPISIQATGSGVLEYALSEDLSPGTHTFSFTASTAGTRGTATTASQTVTATVKAGALSMIGEPLHFPSPFSPTKNRDGITIQYTLSEDADIDIYVFNVAGETVKRITCLAGTEGGKAGLNKIKWDGILDGGGMIGNGIYVTTIIVKKEGRLLAKLKINVFD